MIQHSTVAFSRLSCEKRESFKNSMKCKAGGQKSRLSGGGEVKGSDGGGGRQKSIM